MIEPLWLLTHNNSSFTNLVSYPTMMEGVTNILLMLRVTGMSQEVEGAGAVLLSEKDVTASHS